MCPSISVTIKHQKKMRAIQFVCLLGVFVVVVKSACHYSARQESDDEDTCEHPEFPGYRVKVGSNIQTPSCLNITCFENGMSVCEFGWRLARVVGLPDECKKIKVGDCGVKFVKADDEETFCFEDKDLAYNSV